MRITWNFEGDVPQASNRIYDVVDMKIFNEKMPTLQFSEQQVEVMKCLIIGINSYLEANNFPMLCIEIDHIHLLDDEYFDETQQYIMNHVSPQTHGFHLFRRIYVRRCDEIAVFASRICHELIHEAGYGHVHINFFNDVTRCSTVRSGITCNDNAFNVLNEAVTEVIACKIRESMYISTLTEVEQNYFSTDQGYRPALAMYYGLVGQIKKLGLDAALFRNTILHDYFFGTFAFPRLLHSYLPGKLTLLHDIPFDRLSHGSEMIPFLEHFGIDSDNLATLVKLYAIS
jgi:hypothetical protein